MVMTPIHGGSVNGRKTPEYSAWVNMKQRCLNPSSPLFVYYGGRGISVCQRWRESFQVFLSDIGLRPSAEYTLERLDNERNYEPGNVAWATRTAQQRNRRTTRKVTWNGVTLPLVEWAERLGIHPMSLEKRLRRWPIDRAMTSPITCRDFTHKDALGRFL